MFKQWTVYCHIHVESGRRYIGVTSRRWQRRWAQHVVQSRSSKGGRWHFPNAIRKYGPEAFVHQILGVHSSLEEGNWFEKFWILLFDTTDPEKGFNLTQGGGSKPHPIRKNPWDDPKFRERSILAAKRRTSDPRIHRILTENGVKSKGRTHSVDSRAKISAANKRRGPEVFDKMRNTWAKKPKRTHCSAGHSMHDAYVRATGQRVCRICASEENARRRHLRSG